MSGEVKLTENQRAVLADLLKGPAFYAHATVANADLRSFMKPIRGRPSRKRGPAIGAWYEITPSGLAVLQGGGKTNTVSVAESGSTALPKSDSDGGH